MNVKSFLLVILFAKLFVATYSVSADNLSLESCLKKLDYIDSVHFEHSGYKRSLNLYLENIECALNILDEPNYSIEEKQNFLVRLYISYQNLAGALNQTDNPLGIEANWFYYNIQGLDEHLIKNIDSLKNVGIGVIPYDCENSDMYFSPSTDFFLDYSTQLKYDEFSEFLSIKKLEDQGYYPRSEGFACEGGITARGLLKFIVPYENYLKKYPGSRFFSIIWDHYSKASSLFISRYIFLNPHCDFECAYDDIIAAYEDYITILPEGYLSNHIIEITESLNKYSKLFSSGGNYDLKRKILTDIFHI